MSLFQNNTALILARSVPTQSRPSDGFSSLLGNAVSLSLNLFMQADTVRPSWRRAGGKASNKKTTRVTIGGFIHLFFPLSRRTLRACAGSVSDANEGSDECMPTGAQTLIKSHANSSLGPEPGRCQHGGNCGELVGLTGSTTPTPELDQSEAPPRKTPPYPLGALNQHWHHQIMSENYVRQLGDKRECTEGKETTYDAKSVLRQ